MNLSFTDLDHISIIKETPTKISREVRVRSTNKHLFLYELQFDQQTQKNFIDLLTTLSSHPHPSISKMYQIPSQHPTQTLILQKLSKFSNIEKEIKLKKNPSKILSQRDSSTWKLSMWNLSELKSISLQLISACAHLETLGIVHLNIKPSSIVKFSQTRYKLVNFTHACKKNRFDLERYKEEIRPILKNRISSNTQRIKYFSPELKKAVESQDLCDVLKSDVYSLGLVLLSMGCLDCYEGFFGRGEDLWIQELNGSIDRLKMDKFIQELLHDMLKPNADERPKFTELNRKYFITRPQRSLRKLKHELNVSSKARIVVGNPQRSVVVKQYFPDFFVEFFTEIEYYESFQNCEIFPKVRSVDIEKLCIGLEYFDESLSDFLGNGQTLFRVSEVICHCFVLDLIKAFAFLEKNNLVHRQINLRHIMITKKFKLKIIDLAQMRSLIFGQVLNEVLAGNENFKAPEIFYVPAGEMAEFDLLKADVYSLGMVIFQIIDGFVMKDLNDPRRKGFLNGKIEALKNVALREILNKMLCDVQERLSFVELLEYAKPLLKQ